MFTNANFENTVLFFVPARNEYNDYVPDWYRVIGYQLQSTMFVNALMPYVGFVTSYSLRKFHIVRDKGLCTKGLKTKTLTL